jgi:hypothetical protein
MSLRPVLPAGPPTMAAAGERAAVPGPEEFYASFTVRNRGLVRTSESTEGGGHALIWRDVNGGTAGAPGIGSDASIISTGAAAAQADQFTQFDRAPGGLHQAHDHAHG